MNFKDITISISERENIPVGKVRKISKAFLEFMGEAIDKNENLRLPGLQFVSRTVPARDAEDDKPARPERKIATLRRRLPKASQES